MFQPPQRLPWMSEAACIHIGGDLWFPEGTHREHLTLEREAIRICQSCPVSQQCLDYALDLGSTLEGIWGATTSDDRRQLLKQLDNKKRRDRRKAQ